MLEQQSPEPFNKHVWADWKFTGITLVCCNNCGVVRRTDGSNDDKPCKGKVRVTLR